MAGLDPSLPFSADAAFGATPSEHEQERPRIDGYQVRAALGRGGMGTVWHATESATRREVALKLIRGSAFGSPRARARFEREVDALARLEHPHIARLYHSGLDRGVCFYAMQLVHGRHLDEHVRDHRLDQRAILTLLMQTARAIDYAHQRGIIHRDLKPSNIVVSDEGTPHVVDFGLAKAVADPRGPTVSVEGAVAGTLAYMSPEQAAGDLGRVDFRSDVYSLGVILYELLTGALPHDDSGSMYDTQRRIIEDEPRRPRALSRAIDRDLEAILLKAIARVPEQRYATAGALADDLDNYLRGAVVTARRLTLRYLLTKRVRQHKGRVSAGLAVLLVLIAGAIIAYHRIAAERNRATAAAAHSEHALYLNRIALANVELERNNVMQVRHLLDQCPEHLRAWEWDYLDGKLDAAAWRSAPGSHTARVMTITADGSELRAIGADRLYRTFDPKSGELLTETKLPVHGLTNPFHLSDRGTYIVVADAEGVHVFRHDQLEAPMLTVPLPAGRLGGVRLDEAGRRLALSTSQDLHGRVRIWQLEPRRLLYDTGVLPYNINAMAFVGDDTFLCVTDRSLHRVRHLDGVPWADAIEWGRDRFFPDRFYRFALAPDRRHAVTGHVGGALRVWDLDTGELIEERDAHAGTVQALAFDPASQTLVSAGRDGLIRLWDWPAMQPRATLRGHRWGVDELVFAPEGGRLYSVAGVGLELFAWDLTSSAAGHGVAYPVFPHPKDVAYAPDGERLIVATHEGGADLLTADLQLVRRFEPEAMLFTLQAGFDPSGERVAVAFNNAGIHLFDARDGTELWRVTGGNDANFAFSPDGRWIVTNSNKSVAFVRDARTGEAVTSFAASRPMAFSPDGQFLFARDPDDIHRAAAWNTADWTPAFRLPAHDEHLTALAVSPDGHWLATADGDGVAKVWDLTRREAVLTCAPDGGVSGVAFSADGRRLLTAGDALKLWDITAGSEVLSLSHPHDQRFQNAVFSPDGRTIAALAFDGVRLWPAGPAR